MNKQINKQPTKKKSDQYIRNGKSEKHIAASWNISE